MLLWFELELWVLFNGSNIMLGIFFSFIVSIILTQLVLSTAKYHAFASYDNDLNSVQKRHSVPTPRIGGACIFIGFFSAILVDRFFITNDIYAISLSVSALMIFIIGILEDLTKVVTPIIRITAITLSVILAIYVTKVLPILPYTDFLWLDTLIANYPVIGLCLSLFCVVGLTNAYNIIDGFNGLTSTSATVNLLGITLIAFFVQDISVLNITVILIAAIFGFWLFNYPWGKIFLGDGGAYFIGFTVAVISLHLAYAHKGFMSPYSVLLMAVYPITEIGFSMYRRKFIHRTQCMKPDAMHLHQLVYHRCVPLEAKNRNSRVMPLLLFFIIPQTVLAVVFYKSTAICLLLILVYIIFYVTTYFSIIRFKTFGFLKILL